MAPVPEAGLLQTRVQAAGAATRLVFHALFATGSPKQSASRRFCSHTVQAPAKPNPLRSHSIALYGASGVKRFRPRWLSACTLGGSQAALAARLTCWLGHADQTSQLLRAGRHRTLSGAWAQTSSSVKADLRRSEGSLPSGADHRATPLYSVSPQKA